LATLLGTHFDRDDGSADLLDSDVARLSVN
jgi:hypothetical protein